MKVARKMKAETKEFHLGDVLSVTTGWMLSPCGMDGLLDILNFTMGLKNEYRIDGGLPFSLIYVADRCKAELFKQFPQLRKVNTSGLNKENYKTWLAKQIAKYGETLTVKQSQRAVKPPM